MTFNAKYCISFLLLTLGTTASVAGEPQRDVSVDLIRIATRYVDNYSKRQHKAGDVDGTFIEDVVISSVVSTTNSYRGNLPSTVRLELYRFLISGKSMASEELATLAGYIYRISPEQFCSDVSKLSKVDRLFLIQQASDSLVLNGISHSKLSCQ